jgi:hypothetical protein
MVRDAKPLRDIPEKESFACICSTINDRKTGGRTMTSGVSTISERPRSTEGVQPHRVDWRCSIRRTTDNGATPRSDEADPDVWPCRSTSSEYAICRSQSKSFCEAGRAREPKENAHVGTGTLRNPDARQRLIRCPQLQLGSDMHHRQLKSGAIRRMSVYRSREYMLIGPLQTDAAGSVRADKQRRNHGNDSRWLSHCLP